MVAARETSGCGGLTMTVPDAPFVGAVLLLLLLLQTRLKQAVWEADNLG